MMEREARISDCGEFRWSLLRRWRDGSPRVAWIMMNPSRADAQIDDRTIRRVIGFSDTNGFGCAEVVNLYAYRATDPYFLAQAIGRRGYVWAVGGGVNETAISEAVDQASVVVAAWGASPLCARPAPAVVELARSRGIQLQCLGTSRNGHPRHPLYVRSTAKLRAWTR